MINSIEKEKELAAKEAIKFINNNQIVGLGTGSTAAYAIKGIGELVKNGLKIKAIPTSNRTKEMAILLNIPLIDINTIDSIDVSIDGADEFDSKLNLIKGGGGALLREKIVASLTKELIIIVDSTKKVDTLGKFKLPIEVIPFASNYVLKKVQFLNGEGKIRMLGDTEFITDEGNYIIDVDFGLISDPIYLSSKLNEIEGIVSHGLFIKLARKVIMGNNDTTISFESK
ncbi:ribose-5-phosphate isomerase RpiA [Rhodocytophaga rosea]|uniref:Ribose-5-phosphate isomerase A n=1 Tax=Rhodocytophaga rosea TaxID=2704465 RepID=A0A6C0GBT5_9BACT|nr:ribose-5-phosphate isomerase RpiA [Rhodocytophaga rosea]QHT65348.1 ribose-5-phosphate isomerase RpiA [Rhodocytophaga rosea]